MRPEESISINDLPPGKTVQFRASPQIKTHPSARSGPNVLVNHFYDWKFFSGRGIPMAFWFDKPVASIGMWLGAVADFAQDCDKNISAKATVYYCQRAQMNQKTVTVSSAFNTPLGINDPQAQMQRRKIDYGNAFCPDAINELAFFPPAGQCIYATPHEITSKSHSINSIANTARRILGGTVSASGILKFVKVNGGSVGFHDSVFNQVFSVPVTRKRGHSTFTILAENASGLKDSEQGTISLGTPFAAAAKQFHPTQGGVVKNKACDADTPFVPGKTGSVRIHLDVRTASASGATSHEPPVKDETLAQRSLWRQAGQRLHADDLLAVPEYVRFPQREGGHPFVGRRLRSESSRINRLEILLQRRPVVEQTEEVMLMSR
jgi:hypothetical protein